MEFVREPEPGFQLSPTESTVYQGDAGEILKQLPEKFFHCVITSPPYWGLRDYGAAGQIGAEEDPDEYVQRLAVVFDQARRVLRDDGTLWLNLGDCYTSGNRNYRAPDKKNPIRAMSYRAKTPQGLKPKDLVGIPWRSRSRYSVPGGTSGAISYGKSPTACRRALKIGRPARMSTFFY